MEAAAHLAQVAASENLLRELQVRPHAAPGWRGLLFSGLWVKPPCFEPTVLGSGSGAGAWSKAAMHTPLVNGYAWVLPLSCLRTPPCVFSPPRQRLMRVAFGQPAVNKQKLT